MAPRQRMLLPFWTRVRLWLTGWIDGIAYRLINAGHWRTAIRLWRACGLWH